jgi:hypothetical protein
MHLGTIAHHAIMKGNLSRILVLSLGVACARNRLSRTIQMHLGTIAHHAIASLWC